MAFSVESKKVNELCKSAGGMFQDVEEMGIRETGALLQSAGDMEHIPQSAKNIASSFGNFIARILNMGSSDPAAAFADRREYLILLLKIAFAPYAGLPVQYRVHRFNAKDPVESKCIRDLEGLEIGGSPTGMEKMPDRMLELVIAGRPTAIYYPRWKCFIPGAKCQDGKTCGMAPEAFMKEKPYAARRLRAILTHLFALGVNPDVIQELLGSLGGPLSDEEMELYRGEEAERLADDVREYILAVSPDADPEGVCGCLGKRTPGKLLDIPTAVNVGGHSAEGLNACCQYIGNQFVLIPPARDVKEIRDASYSFGPPDKQGMPAYIEFQAELDGQLYHKIYTCRPRICRPDSYVDLAYRTPDELIKRRGYLVQESAAGAVEGEEAAVWRELPEDPQAADIYLHSRQYECDWKIRQRSRIERLELCGAATGEVWGTVVPEKKTVFRAADKKMYLCLDPAGAQSVRIVSVDGSDRSGGLEYRELFHPMTPMAREDWEQAAERRMSRPERNADETHFDSLFQEFSVQGEGTWASLGADGRLWEPDEDIMFSALRAYPGSMREAANELGVVANMKELLTRPGLSANERYFALQAMKRYIGVLLYEGVLSLGRYGYAVQAGNLEILISYPDNGTGAGITRDMREAIEGAAAYVNEHAAGRNKLEIGKNVFLYPESLASAAWNQANPPEGIFMGESCSVITSDCGHSTHDVSLRANGCTYQSSVPYAGQKITHASMAQVFRDDPDGIIRCFKDMDVRLERNAKEALREVMDYKRGKLQERFGFTLTLNRLFNQSRFCVTGANAARKQIRFQELTEMKLNIAIPAYAQLIARAVRDGNLSQESGIYLVPVGRGSLALQNTAPGFPGRFADRLRAETDYLLGCAKYSGGIFLLPNRDTDKISVAQGMLEIKKGEENGIGERENIITADGLTGHYLDLAYGTGPDADTEGRRKFLAELESLTSPSRRLDYSAKKDALYQDAFHRLVDRYTFEKFEEAFNRFGYTGIDGIIDAGALDRDVCRFVGQHFQNLCQQIKQDAKDLVMSCPFAEEEMLCSALIDAAVGRMTFSFEDETR